MDIIPSDSVECYATEPGPYIVATYMTLGACSDHCRESGLSVFAAHDETCACFDILPSYDEKVDASKCNLPCPGYAGETCESQGGGQPGLYSVGTVPGLLVTPSRASSLSASTTGTITTSIASNVTASVSSSQTSPATTVVSPSNTSSNASPSGSSGSASPTAESSAVGTPIFSKGATVVASIWSAVAVLAALI